MSVAALLSSPVKTPKDIAKEQEKFAKIQKEADDKSQMEQIFLRDEQFWKSGDYIIKEGNLKHDGAKAYGIYNTKTQKWVLDPNKQKDNTGRIAIFRKIKKNDDFWMNFSGSIRLLNCINENSTFNKTLVWMHFIRDYKQERKQWDMINLSENKENMFFVINDNDELEELQPLATGFKNVFLLNQNGKYGVAIVGPDSLIDQNYKYGYFGYEIKVPVEYDSVEVFNNFKDKFEYITSANVVYLAKNKDDVYMFSFFGERLSPKLAEYDSVTALPGLMEDFYIVSKDGKFGAVNGVGMVIVPLIYDSETLPYIAVRDIVPDIYFSHWCNNKVKLFLAQKGKYEKEDDYQARLKDKEKQSQYILENMKDADKEYIDEFKNKIVLLLSNYDTEKEKFLIKEQIYMIKNDKNVNGMVNCIELPVPIKEAKNFEKNFDKVLNESLKTATYGICNDAIAITKIKFKMPNGKTYIFNATKK